MSSRTLVIDTRGVRRSTRTLVVDTRGGQRSIRTLVIGTRGWRRSTRTLVIDTKGGQRSTRTLVLDTSGVRRMTLAVDTRAGRRTLAIHTGGKRFFFFRRVTDVRLCGGLEIDFWGACEAELR